MVRQRPDRDIETVDWLRLGVLANLEIEPAEGLRTSLGAGAERRQLDDIVVVGSNPDVPEPFVHNRWVVSMQGDMLLDTQEIRLDQRHELDFELRATFEDSETFLWASRANYQRVFGFGWHDLWLRAHGAALWGDVPFIEQEPVTRHLRGVFPDEYYVNGIASASAEFRFSLSRDIFKLSSFADAAVFDHRRQDAARKERRAGISAGVGFHALIVEVVQLNVYAAYGAVTDGNRDIGMAASLAKAF
jgi:hypothetical protein